MLDILRSNDEKAKRIFDDIYFPFDYTAHPLQIHKQDNSSIKLFNIITQLKEFNLDESTATRYAELYLEKFPDDDTAKLVVKILLVIKEDNKFNLTATVKQPKGKTRKKNYTKDDLRLNKDDNKQNEDVHKELKEKGMIKDPIKDFMDDK